MPEEFVEVLYDYNYTTVDGKNISIHQGDIYGLLAKSTDEWWKVRTDNMQRFFVPASYVRLVKSTETSAMRKISTNGPFTIQTDIPEMLDNASKLKSKSHSLPRTKSDGLFTPVNGFKNHGERISSPDMSLELKDSASTPSDNSPSTPNSNDTVDYANMEIIQEIIEKRKRTQANTNGTDNSSDFWEMHTDDATGKAYYYNSETQVTTWEMPSIEINSPHQNGNQQNKKESRVSNFRKGWTEAVNDKGGKVYVHNATGEKWHVAVDSSGKEYYYNESSQESSWDLPEGGLLKSTSPAVNSFDKQKKDYLNRAKITEGKKKIKKVWSLAYIVADEDRLIIYKDEKAFQSKPDEPYGKPEAIIDLQHATVEWCNKERSSKKNAFEVTSASGTCYLLQHEDSMLIHEWFAVIQQKIKMFNIPVMTSEAPDKERNNNTEKLQNSQVKTRKYDKRLSKQKPRSNENRTTVYTLNEEKELFQSPQPLGPAGEISKKSIKEKLKSFLVRRPAQEVLEKQGILQTEYVFGSRLQFVCDREQTTVPKFVECCIKAIEKKGLDFDGLYRINGNQAQIQKLRFEVDNDKYDLNEYDVHVITGALKLFFRELKEPLIPFQLYNALSGIIREKDKSKILNAMKIQLSTMPTVNLHTLKFLFAHLIRVTEHGELNRMKPQNIAIVFGPTLMWPEKESSAIAVNMMCQNSIVEYILTNFDRIL